MNTTLSNLSPELLQAVNSIAETIKPIIEDIHSKQATSQNYYADYMRILSYQQHKGKGYVKLLAIAMLKAGCNPMGIESAVKNVI